MNFEILCWVVLALAGIPCALFLLNVIAYRRALPPLAGPYPLKISVLIPARNEERNIESTLKSVLGSRGIDFDIVVLDDHSTDRTAELVRAMVACDSRVRLESAPRLPPGWCGKQHACHVLAALARHPILAFIDADVRLAPHALQRLARTLEVRGADLLSGVPRQELGTFSERLLLPLIHFVLLAFLPIFWSRRTRSPAFAAGCGQLVVARSRAYRRCGGHSAIRNSLHDGLKLPRAFRQAGYKTDLVDATDLAVCRMYQTNSEVWRGLAKNATEGLAAPGVIGPMSLLLLGGQVVPWVLVAVFAWMESKYLLIAGSAAGLSLVPRMIASFRYRQSILYSFLHPMGILALLSIQWLALFRQLLGRPSAWKGRVYSVPGAHMPRIGTTQTP